MKNRKNRKIETLQKSFRNALVESQFDQRVRDESPHGLDRSVRQFVDDRANRDGRNLIKQSARERVELVVKRLTRAVTHADRHEDPEVKREARRLVRAARCCPFEDLEDKARHFAGVLNKAGHRRKEREKLARRRRFDIGELIVVELNSSDQLQGTSKELGGLCTAHRGRRSLGWRYFDSLKKGESRFYRLEDHRGRAQALMEVDAETDNVSEIQARGGEEFELPSRGFGLRLLKRLGITADNVDAFSEIGAFAVFKNGRPKVPWIPVDDNEYKVWVFPHHIVLKRRSGPWSLFAYNTEPRRSRRRQRQRRRRQRHSWSAVCTHRDALSVGKLMDLMLRCPALYERVRAIHTPSEESDEG